MNHFIEKITVDLEINDRKDAFDFQNKVSKLFKEKLQQLTEDILDEFSDASSVIKFSNIEIDLGNIRSSSFEKDFIAEYETQLREIIGKRSGKNRKLTGLNFGTSSSSSLPSAHNDIYIFKFFLENGRLPNQALKGFNIDDLFHNILNNQKALTLQTVKPLLKKKKVIHRLVYSFSIQNTELLLKHLLPKTFDPIRIAINNVFSVLKSNVRSTRQQKLHKQLLLNVFEIMQSSDIKTEDSNFDLEELHNTFLNYLPQYWQQTKTPIYTTSFALKKTQKINTEQVSLMTYKEIKQVLRPAENRHQIVSKSTQKQLLKIIETLSGTHSEALKRLIRKTIQASSYVDTKKVKNVVWSTVLKYLTTKKSPTYIDISKVEKMINDNSILIEIERQNQREQQINKQELKQEVNQKIILDDLQDDTTVSFDSIDINKVIELSYTELKTLLEQKEKRQQVVLKSIEQQLTAILKTLTKEKSSKILKVIKKITSKKVKNIDKNLFINLIWSTTLEHLTTFSSPSEIVITEVKKTIQNNLILLESNRKNQQKLRQEKRALENLQNQEEALNYLQDNYLKQDDTSIKGDAIPDILNISFDELILILKQKEKRQQIVVSSTEKQLQAIVKTLALDKSELVIKVIDKAIKESSDVVNIKALQKSVWIAALDKLATYISPEDVNVKEIEKAVKKNQELFKKIDINNFLELSIEEIKTILKQKERRQQIVINNTEEQLFAIISKLSIDKSESILKVIDAAVRESKLNVNSKVLKNAVWAATLGYIATQKSNSEIKIDEVIKVINKSILIIEDNFNKQQEIKDLKALQKQQDKQKVKKDKQPEKINLPKILSFAPEEIRNILKQKEKRQQIVVNSSEKQFSKVISILAEDKSETILKIIEKVTSKGTDKETKILKNIIWSVTLEYLAEHQSPTSVKIADIKKIIQNASVITESKKKEQEKVRQEKRELQNLQKIKEQQEILEDIYQNTIDSTTSIINIPEILDLSYEELRVLLNERGSRQQIIIKSTEAQLHAIVKTLAEDKSEVIIKFVEKIILKGAKNIDYKTFSNIIWSATLASLASFESSAEIKISEVKEAINNRKNILEKNYQEQQEIQELKKIIEIQESQNQTIRIENEGEKISILELLKLPYEELKKWLFKKDNRHQVVTKSTSEQLLEVLNLLSDEYADEIVQLVNTIIDEQQHASIDPITLKNIIWLVVLDYLLTSDSPESIKIKALEKKVLARLKRMENQYDIINKTKEKFEEEQTKNQTQAKEEIEDITPKIIKLNYRVEDILEVYLLEGYFIQPLESHEILLKNLLDNQPRQLRILLTRIGKTTTIIHRLVDKISANTLQRLTKLLVPNMSFINILKEYIDKTNIVNLYQTAIQHQLKYGQVEPTFLFDEFVNNHFDDSDLTSFVQSIYSNLKANSETELLTIIDNYLATIIVIDNAVEEDKLSATRTLDFLTQYIDNPSNNWWLKNISKSYLNQHFHTVIEYHPDSVKTFFYKIAARKDAAKVLTDLLEEKNLTLLMNLIEPNLFGYISTIILTLDGFVATNESWKLALTAYFNIPKPLNINTFTQQAYLQLANQLGNSSSKIQEKLLEYAEKQIKAKQQRFLALKQVLLNDKRLNKQPKLLTEPNAAEFPTIENQPAASNIEIISYYLKYNTLPTGYQHLKKEDIVYRIKKQGFENVNILKIAIRKILDNPAFSKQLTALPDEVINALIQTLQPRVGLFVLPYINDLKQVVEKKILIISALKVTNEITILTHRAGFIQHYVNTMLDTILTTVNMTFEEAVNNIIDDLTDKPQQSNIVKQLRRISARNKKQEEEATIEIKAKPVVEKTNAPLKDTTIYIEHAGVVMLNVFLPFLFKMFNLTEGNKFVDFEASCRAVYMIYYISSGNPSPAEHQLILSKIMCDIPIDQPISTVIVLTEEEQEACNQLIQAGINRWGRMKNASVEGFRNSFLKREGKLVKIPKGWTLSIEQKPFDLLMKTIPWGFSMVKFGWMEGTIYVEWPY